MGKKAKFIVWNKKESKISSVKILKTQKKITKTEAKDNSEANDPIVKFVKDFDEQIRNACK